MANLMASHGATAMDRAVTTTTAGLARLLAHLSAWQSARQLHRLDARQRRDAGLADLAAPRVDVHPGWDVRLQGLR
jgi:hypothetical protein